MREKILALLTAKFAQARKDGLQQLARTLALQVADEAEAQALVDKITVEQVTEFIRDFRREVDAEVTNANRTYENNLKSKYDLVEKKTPGTPPKSDDPNDITAIVQRAVEAAVKPLQDKISNFETGKATETRKQTLEAKLKDAPEAFRKTVLKGFSKMQFKDDNEFNEFITETETDLQTFTQEAANSGLSGFPRPATPIGQNVTKEKVTADIKDWAGTGKKQE